MRIQGVGGVLLSANEPEVLGSWYGRLLGVSFARAPGGHRVEARVGAGRGLLIAIEEAAQPLGEGPRDTALLIEVDDLAALLRRLEHRGIDVEQEEEGPTGKRAWIRDPEGRRVGLQQAEAEAEVEAEKPAAAPAPAPASASESASVPASASGSAPASASGSAPAPAPAIALEAKEADANEPAEAAAPAEPPAAAPADEEDEDDDVAAAPPAEPEHVGAPAPIIVSIRPEKLAAQTGGPLRVLGANFDEACAVRMGGVPLEARRIDSGLLEIQAPPRQTGPCAIDIENPDGQRVAGAVLYERGPEIARILPAEGPPLGGTEVLVEGSGFLPGCVLSFHGTRSPEVRYESATRVWFATPPQEDGPLVGEVRITNPDGLSGAAPEGFRYRLGNPRIHAVSPDRGYLGGGKRITVTGEDLEDRCVGRIGGRPAAATRRNAQTVDLIVPPADAPGAVDVEIENFDGQIARAAGAFTYELPPAPPKLIEVRPDRGYLAGGQEVHLLGDNFDEATVVRIGEVRASAQLVSRNEIVITTPPRAEPGLVAIDLVDGSGVVVRREDGFTYQERPMPQITGLAPRSGPMVGGTKVILEGEHFPANATVRVAKQAPKRVVVRSATQIELLTPPSREAGFVDVEVGSPEVGVAVAKSAFRYDASPPPVIESVAPNRGGTGGGTELSITGKGFVAESVVLIGGKPASKVKILNPTTIDFCTPPGSDGQMVDVVVRNPDGKEAISRRAFQYDARYRG